MSYQQLHESGDATDRAAAEGFGLLGLPDGPELGIPVAARLLDQPQAHAERALERLVDAHLLETPTPGRYRLHDLLRLYARELAGQHPQAQRAAALTRALGFYAATAWQTLALLRPRDPRLGRIDDRWRKGGLELADDQAALAWLEAERPNLVAAAEQAATTPGVPLEIVTQLAHALFGFFHVRKYLQDWAQVNHTALGAARRTGDGAAQAQALNDLGIVHRWQGRYEQALACQQQSLALFRELGDRPGQAASSINLGLVHERQGRYGEALACQQQSLAIYRQLGDRRGQAGSLSNLGVVFEGQGRHQEALACHKASLAIFRELGDRHSQAGSLTDRGVAYERLGRYEEALACQQESLALYRELGDRDGQAECLRKLGVVYQRQGRHEQALACLRKSLTLYRELGMPHGQAESLRELGVTLRALGRHEDARAHWHEALAIFERLHTAHVDQVRALLTEEPSGRVGV